MSAATKTIDPSNSIADVDDINMFQAARRNGRRNALADGGEQFNQVATAMASAEIDQMTPHFQSMSIKH